jgi:hypothetical protein
MQCFHCGRHLKETSHWQTSYRVDDDRLHTGFAEWDYFIGSKEHTPPIRYLKLTNPVNILTCVHCYQLPEIKQKLDDDFKGIAALVALMREAIKHRTPSEAD